MVDTFFEVMLLGFLLLAASCGKVLEVAGCLAPDAVKRSSPCGVVWWMASRVPFCGQHTARHGSVAFKPSAHVVTASDVGQPE